VVFVTDVLLPQLDPLTVKLTVSFGTPTPPEVVTVAVMDDGVAASAGIEVGLATTEMAVAAEPAVWTTVTAPFPPEAYLPASAAAIVSVAVTGQKPVPTDEV
jgi:hypothetical protein